MAEGDTTTEQVTAEDIAFLDTERRAHKDQILNALPEDARRMLEAISDCLTISLGSYMLRPNSDPEILGLTNNVLAGVDQSLSFGQTGEPMSNNRLDQIKAKLTDAARIVLPNPS